MNDKQTADVLRQFADDLEELGAQAFTRWHCRGPDGTPPGPLSGNDEFQPFDGYEYRRDPFAPPAAVSQHNALLPLLIDLAEKNAKDRVGWPLSVVRADHKPENRREKHGKRF